MPTFPCAWIAFKACGLLGWALTRIDDQPAERLLAFTL